MSSTILVGDVRERLKGIPDASVQCCVTSPPYYGLRDYGTTGQIGLEPTIAGYIAAMVEVFREVKRVLRDDGVCWLNIGDSYGGANSGQTIRDSSGGVGGGNVRSTHDQPSSRSNPGRAATPGFKPKDLMMVPARLAIALQDDGWWLRSDIIWAKPNPMPESVTDRPTSAHEHIFLLTKSARYYYDADAVREVGEKPMGANGNFGNKDASARRVASLSGNMAPGVTYEVSGFRNLRNVWEIATQPFPGSHFATFPLEIPRRCIKAGTSEKGACSACGAPWARVVERTAMVIERSGRGDGYGSRVATSGTMVAPPTSVTTGWQPGCSCDADVIPCTVLDPFLGSGTTLLVADQLGRNGIGIELNPEYAEMARKRITSDAPMFAMVEVTG